MGIASASPDSAVGLRTSIHVSGMPGLRYFSKVKAQQTDTRQGIPHDHSLSYFLFMIHQMQWWKDLFRPWEENMKIKTDTRFIS